MKLNAIVSTLLTKVSLLLGEWTYYLLCRNSKSLRNMQLFAMVQLLYRITVTCFPLMVVIFRLLITISGLCVTTFRHKIYGKKFINYAFNGKIVTYKTAIINNTKMIYYY